MLRFSEVQKVLKRMSVDTKNMISLPSEELKNLPFDDQMSDDRDLRDLLEQMSLTDLNLIMKMTFFDYGTALLVETPIFNS